MLSNNNLLCMFLYFHMVNFIPSLLHNRFGFPLYSSKDKARGMPQCGMFVCWIDKPEKIYKIKVFT